MHFLTVTPVVGEPYRVQLRTQETRLGRSGHNDLILTDRAVSRRHAVIASQAGGDYLCDLGSRGHTLLNGQLVRRPTLLQSGDQIRVGNTILVYDGPAIAPVSFDHEQKPRVVERISSGERERPTPIPSRTYTETGSAHASESPPQESRYLRMILEADKTLNIQLTLNELWIRVLELVQREIPFERGVILTQENGELMPRATRVHEHETGKSVRVSTAVIRQVMESRESLLVANGLDTNSMLQRNSMVSAGVRSLMCAPLLSGDRVLGLIYVDTHLRHGPFTADSLRVLSHLASLAASRMESRRLLERARLADIMNNDLRQAADIQARLFPGDPPDVPGYAIHGTSEACRSVGGDHLDYFLLKDGRLALSIGDVAGKGLPAAFIMCSLHSMLRALAQTLDCPAETVTTLSSILQDDLPPNRFVTLFYGILDPRTHRLTYVNAGHCQPLLMHADGTIDELEVSGTPAGVLHHPVYPSHTVSLAEGDLLVSVSDGILEASNLQGTLFGNQRLLEQIRQHGGSHPLSLVERLLSAVASFRGTQPQEDDITLVALRRLERSGTLN